MPLSQFLALITPLSGDAHPEHPIVIPPGPGQPPGHPEHPIPPIPAHPIVIPPDAIAPGVPTHPIYIPVYPAHPIVIPPGAIGPGVPAHPIVLPPPVIWGPNDPRPTPPIVIPPDALGPGLPSHPISLPPAAAPPGYDWTQTFVPAQEAHWEWSLTPEPPHPELLPKK